MPTGKVLPLWWWEWLPWWQRLSQSHCLVRYDQRGNGLSDEHIGNADFETLVDDLAFVIDELKLDTVSLLGISQGCAVSIAYAVRYPQRVKAMVLYGGYMKGWANRGTQERQRGEAFSTLIKQGWGQDNPAYRQLFTNLFLPDGTPEQAHWFNELQRISTSASSAKAAS